jgi:hypothetical protein
VAHGGAFYIPGARRHRNGWSRQYFDRSESRIEGIDPNYVFGEQQGWLFPFDDQLRFAAIV